jgi:hypothetical protein
LRNYDRKREYDRKRYAEKRAADPVTVREQERLRKAVQRKRRKGAPLAGDRGSIDNPFSLDTARTTRELDKQAYREWAANEAN